MNIEDFDNIMYFIRYELQMKCHFLNEHFKDKGSLGIIRCKYWGNQRAYEEMVNILIQVIKE